MTTIKDRLTWETEIMGYIAENLSFLYISDKDYFLQQLNINIQAQQSQLDKDGIASEFFYISGNEVLPFQVSNDTLPDIPESVITAIKEEQNGQFQQSLANKTYTISFQQMDEIDGIYVLMTDHDSFLGPIENMGFTTILIIISSIIVSIGFIIFFAEEMMAASQEQYKGTERTANIGRELLDLSKTLEKMTNRFRTKA